MKTNSHSKPNQSELRDLRVDIEIVLVEWAASNNVDLSIIQKHSLIYGAAPDIMSLVESQRTEAQLQLLDELEANIRHELVEAPTSDRFVVSRALDDFTTNKRQELTETGDNKKRMKGVS